AAARRVGVRPARAARARLHAPAAQGRAAAAARRRPRAAHGGQPAVPAPRARAGGRPARAAGAPLPAPAAQGRAAAAARRRPRAAHGGQPAVPAARGRRARPRPAPLERRRAAPAGGPAVRDRHRRRGGQVSALRGTAREAAAEFLGTFVLIVFGSGVVAQVVLSGGANGSYVSINVAWGLAVTMGVYVAAGVSQAHLNPAAAARPG